jgi:hypothetical protein
MNCDGLKVVFRTKATFVSAGLELESQRAFAVISVSGPRDTKPVIGRERMELDVRFLQKMNESEYLYKKLVELPKSGRSWPVVDNRECGRDSPGERLLLGP